MFGFAGGMELITSLGLIVVLGYFYGLGLRWFRYPKGSEYLLGAIFGAAAIFQMYRPFEPLNGLIIDLRNIPIALAGAFLGWRGIFLSVAIAASVRIGTSGAGMLSGVMGIITAAGMGAIWARWTETQEKRGLYLHLALAAMISMHLLCALLLPPTMRAWFFSEAAFPILMLNLLIVPIAAGILEVERRKFSEEMRLRNSVVLDPESGLLTIQAFTRACEVRASAMADSSYTRALVIRMRTDSWLESWSVSFSPLRLLAAMKVRIEDILPHAKIAGFFGQRTLLVPLTQDNLLEFDELATKLRRSATDEAYGLPGNISVHISVEMKIVKMSQDRDLGETLKNLRFGLAKNLLTGMAGWKANTPTPRVSDVRATHCFPPCSTEGMRVEKMFQKADLLMETNTPRKGHFEPTIGGV